MSEEQPQIEDPTVPEKEAPAVSKTTVTPVMALGFLVVLLVAVLLVMKSRESGNAPAEDVTGLQAKLSVMKSEVNRERMALGMGPLPASGEVDSLDHIAKRLKNDADTLVSLAGSFQGMLAEKDALLTVKGEELVRSEQLRQALISESARLNAELQRALVLSSDLDSLRRELATVKAQRDAISSELAAARQQIAAGNAGSSAEFDDLRRRLDETRRAKEFFESRVKELEAELAKARLFANSESELLPAAVELFRTLRQLEGVPDSELMTSYSNLGMKLGANVMHTLPFATGSSALSPEDDATLRRLTDETPDGDLILVIGYASETGNVDSNARLSSDRATAAAQMISSVKRPGQLVQAVYLGQTDRFSSRIPERNQLCEVWRIRKK